jgi:mono/diheme cytochrome c family protein
MRRLLILALALGAAACRQDMHDQPKLEPLEHSAFFADGRASRPVQEGTVARGQFFENTTWATGKTADGQLLLSSPVPVTRALLDRGQQRYDIYCSPCHARTGNGTGMIVQRGYRKPPSFHEERLRQAPDGHFFDSISNGFGVMPKYAAQVPIADRWAIVAYVRALQLSQHATLADVPAANRPALDGKQP